MAMKTLVTAAALAFATLVPVVPANAQGAPSCRPLESMMDEASSLDLEVSTVLESQQAGFASAYGKALGRPLPPDVEPVGMLFVTGENGLTLVGIIENPAAHCVRYTTLIQTTVHAVVFGMAAAGV